MIKTAIIDAYKSINESKRKYGVFHKCLFHIHTPASDCFQLYDSYNDSSNYKKMTDVDLFRIAKDEKLFPQELIATYDEFPCDDDFTDKKEYISFLLIAHKLSVNSIKLAIIADHNTILGFQKLKKAIAQYEKLYDRPVYTEVLLGVEISCADKNHVIGIFNPKKKKIEDSLSLWLSENIMSIKEGTYRTSYDILSDISEKFNGIGYIAHFDTSDTFKDSDFLNGAYKKMLFSIKPLLIGLSNIERRSEITTKIMRYTNTEPIFFWDCDAHSIDGLNNKAFWIKGQQINFDMLRDSIRDSDIAIRYCEPKESRQSILGLVVEAGNQNFLSSKVDNKPFCVQFSDSLNCFIGGRGTGKSTIINMINFVLGQHLPENSEKGRLILEFICKHPSICIFYRYEGNDYAVLFRSPNKTFADDDIVKSFVEPTSCNYAYGYKFPYDNKKIAAFSMKKFIEVYKINARSNHTNLEKMNLGEKRLLLEKFFVAGYSTNELVNLAGSEFLSGYIYSILFKNNTLSQAIVCSARSKKGLITFVERIENYLSQRNQDVNCVIASFNNAQKNKLRIIYSQDGFQKNPLAFENILHGKGNWYKGYNISFEMLVDYLYALNSRIGTTRLVKGLLGENPAILNNIESIVEFCSEMTIELIDQGVTEITNDDLETFYGKLKNDLFSQFNIGIWVSELNTWVKQIETFDIVFNVNNRELHNNEKPKYKPVRELSLGQKVVAMLSFVLGYSEYSKDFTPLVIDQPEDNLDNQYIYRNLVKDLREIKDIRQVIIATHSATIVTNAKSDQVIVMASDNEHGWADAVGYPTNRVIIKNIISHLEGGVESFKHKSFVYDSFIKTH